jgi:hypothetical protein
MGSLLMRPMTCQVMNPEAATCVTAHLQTKQKGHKLLLVTPDHDLAGHWTHGLAARATFTRQRTDRIRLPPELPMRQLLLLAERSLRHRRRLDPREAYPDPGRCSQRSQRLPG